MAAQLSLLGRLMARAAESADAVAAAPAPPPPRKSRRKPIPGGKSWHEVLGHQAAPRPGEASYRPDPMPQARRTAAAWYRRLRTLWTDPDTYAAVGALLERAGAPLEGYDLGDEYGEEDPFTWSPDEIAELAGVPPELLPELLWTVGQLEPNGGDVPARLGMELLAEAAASTQEGGLRPRLVLVPPDEARAFVARHHSEFPAASAPGLLYSYGVRVGPRLVAVALVNTPTGGFRDRAGCPVDGIVELTRIASDASQRGASSMLASRAIDLLPLSGRRGVPGCLLVTYSLLSEAGMTYLALVDKGMRPTHLVRGQLASGQRAGAAAGARPEERKIAWQAGPGAAPPDWSLLEGRIKPELLASTIERFNKWQERQAKAAARAAQRGV